MARLESLQGSDEDESMETSKGPVNEEATLVDFMKRKSSIMGLGAQDKVEAEKSKIANIVCSTRPSTLLPIYWVFRKRFAKLCRL